MDDDGQGGKTINDDDDIDDIDDAAPCSEIELNSQGKSTPALPADDSFAKSDDPSEPAIGDPPASSSTYAYPGRIIESRYTLLGHLGNGAHGQVWIAHDRITDERVALKWLHVVRASTHAGVRREITTLRILRFPGITQFIDEGIADGKPFIVMELVTGSHFPGNIENGSPWSTIESTTLALLETLSQIHAAGVVHRDLKPGNVLVRPDGRPVIVDFGISHVQDVHPGRAMAEGVVGTPLYLAPEQILGRPVDARADLYAVGVMLYEALTNQLPHNDSDRAQLFRKRLAKPAPSVLQFAPSVPPRVANVVDRLLALRPEERFASAADVIAALQGQSNAANAGLEWLRSHLDSHGCIAQHDLVELFVGPDRLLHLREDAARVLHERTRGNPDHVELELERWVRLGIAFRNGPRFAVTRASLEWLAGGSAGAAEEQQLHALLSRNDLIEATRETVLVATRYATTGRLGAATRTLAEGLRLARNNGASAEERNILISWTKVALAERGPRAPNHVLYECARSAISDPILEQLQNLLRAGLAASGARKHQALEAANALGVLNDPELERARHRIRIHAAAVQTSPVLIAEILEAIEEWWRRSGHPLAELSLLEGRARQRYHEGRFEEAANLYMQAALRETWATTRIETMLRSASASMEAFQHEIAVETAESAGSLAREARHALLEGRAQWVLRSAYYRLGKTTGPDIELVDVVSRVGDEELEALVCLNEGAAAMRADSSDSARMLANRAATIWRRMKRPNGMMMARALAITCGAQTDVTEVQNLAELAIACKTSGLGIQVLALLGRAYPTMHTSWQPAIRNFMNRVPMTNWDQRMDILSIREAAAGVL